MSELVERLRAACIDWDGSHQDDAELPRVELHCRDLREAADRIEALEAKEAAGQWLGGEPDEDGIYLCWCDTPPQSYHVQVVKRRAGRWLTSWSVEGWSTYPPPPKPI